MLHKIWQPKEIEILKQNFEKPSKEIQSILLENGFDKSFTQIVNKKKHINEAISKAKKSLVFAYISIDEVLRDEIELQKNEIINFSKENSLKIDKTYIHIRNLSGIHNKTNESENINNLIASGSIKKGDTLVISELGIFDDWYFRIIPILELLLEKDINLVSIKEQKTLNISFDKKGLGLFILHYKAFYNMQRKNKNDTKKKENRIKKGFIMRSIKEGVISQNTKVSPCMILEANIENVKAMYQEGKKMTTIANFFGVSDDNVYGFLKGKGIHKVKPKKNNKNQ